MNNKPDINDLFDAARRQEADLRRQQKLSDMIDQMAAAETPRRRRPLWMFASVAASVLLLVTFGVHFLFGADDGLQAGPIFVETQPVQPAIVADTLSDVRETVVDASMHVVKNHGVLLAEEVSVEHHEVMPNESEPEQLPDPQPEQQAQPERLLAEDAAVAVPDTPQVAVVQRRVYERTSSRLVCGSGCRPEVRPSQEDSPRFAFTNISSTGTTIGIGGGEF